MEMNTLKTGESRSLRILAAGGGSGGHLFPALAIVQELQARRNCEVCFVGTTHGLESRVIPLKGYAFRTLWISGLHRGHMVKNLLFPLKVLVSLFQAISVIRGFNPDLVLGTGSYTSWPLLTAALLLKKKSVIQEQNWKPGLVNRILAPHVRSVHLSFEESRQFFRKQSNLHVSGNPVRRDILSADKNRAYTHFQLSDRRTTLFIFGGSQGSKVINEIFQKIVNGLMKRENLQVLWATGPRWFEDIEKSMKRTDRARILPFISEMGLAYRISDLILCRSGATTVAEVTALGIPVVFIPFGGASENHQEKNALLLERAGAARVIVEKDLTEDRLQETLNYLLDHPEERMGMADEAKKLGRKGAAVTIADQIEHMISEQ